MKCKCKKNKLKKNSIKILFSASFLVPYSFSLPTWSIVHFAKRDIRSMLFTKWGSFFGVSVPPQLIRINHVL